MNKWLKILMVTIIFCMAGCSNNEGISDNIIKDGDLYTMDNISFYYPTKYEINKKRQNLITFTYNDTTLSLEQSDVSDGNGINELVELYRLDLEEKGNVILSNTQITLDNGDSSQEIVYQNQTIKGKSLVSFEDNKMIVFKYEATEKEYDEDISSINYYLYSLTIKEEEEQIADTIIEENKQSEKKG